MRKSLVFSLCMSGTLLVAATSRSDVGGDTAAVVVASPTGTGVAAAPEPITGTAVTPVPGSETPPRNFLPYDIGPSKWNTSPHPFWAYADLNAAEKVWADKNADTTGWDNVNNAYASAAAEMAQRAATASAAAQLGLDNPSVGVVP